MPHSIKNIPSHLPPNILFSTINVSTEFAPPNAILALILSVISFFSITADDVSTNNTPYPKFFDILFLYTDILASVSAFTPAFLLYPINVLDSILV